MVVSKLVVCNLYAEALLRSFEDLPLRSFSDLHLRSFALICLFSAHLRVSANDRV